MGIFSLSDLIISVTLIFNALALLATKSHPTPIPNANSQSSHESVQQSEGLISGQSPDGTDGTTQLTIQQRFDQVFHSIRKLSCILVIWNAVFCILMIFVFRG